MRASERSFPDNVIRLIKASHTVYLCYFQRLFPSHGRKNGRNPSGKHRLARSRCACHQNIMGTCGRNLKRAFSDDLALNFRKIDITGFCLCVFFSHCLREVSFSDQKFNQFPQRLRPVHFNIITEQCFVRDFRCHEISGYPCGFAGQYHGQYAGNRPYFPLKRKLSDENHIFQTIQRNTAVGRQKSDCNRKVKPRAVLFQVCRRQIDDDFISREAVPGISDCRIDPFLRFFDRCGRKSDYFQCFCRSPDIYFHPDYMPVEPIRCRS